MKTYFLTLLISAAVVGCARQPGAAPPPRPIGSAPAPAPTPSPQIDPTTTPPSRDKAAAVRPAEEFARQEDQPAAVDAQRISAEERQNVSGRKLGYVPPVAENETAVIENQANLGTAPLTEEDDVSVPENLPLLSYATAPCFGDCDVYRLVVLPDGRMTLEVEQGIRRPGTYLQTLSTFDRRDLMVGLDSLRSVDFAPVYPVDPAAIPDDGSPTTVTLPAAEGGTRTVTVYYDAPAELERFLRRVHTLIEEQPWTAQPR